MKKRIIVGAAVFAALICCIGSIALAGLSERTFTFFADSVIEGQEYLLLVADAARSDLDSIEDDDILYMDQKKAQGTTISFAETKLPDFNTATAFIISEEGALVQCQVIKNRPVDMVVLPKNVRLIDEEAFVGISAAVVKVPEGVREIRRRAFAECPRLREVYIPKSVTTIEEDVFSDSSEVVLFGYMGSVAEIYAKQNGLPFICLD